MEVGINYKIAQKSKTQIEVIFNNNDKILFQKWGNQWLSMQNIPIWLDKSSELYQQIKRDVKQTIGRHKRMDRNFQNIRKSNRI